MQSTAGVSKRIALTLVASVTVACADETTRPVPADPIAGFRGTEFRSQTPRRQKPSEAELRHADRLARVMRAALNDRDVREYVKSALAASAVKESKLHLATFLSGRGGPLLDAMVARGGVSLDELRTVLANLRDLEFYMPVRTHREAWTGDQQPVIAVALTGNDVPIAYDHNGHSLLLDHRFAPLDPVLVLAPVEANFDRQREENIRGQPERQCAVDRAGSLASEAKACERSGAGEFGILSYISPDTLAGVYVTRIEFLGDECRRECWWWGNPEYEMHSMSNALPSATAFHSCAADFSDDYPPNPDATARSYDQNKAIWAGKVRILSNADVNALIDAGEDGTFAVTFWEDDYEQCQVHHAETLEFLVNQAIVVGTAKIVTVLCPPCDVFLLAQMFSGVVTFLHVVTGALNSDEFIGVGIDRSATSYSSDNNFVIQGVGGVLKGYATVKPYGPNGPYIGPVSQVRSSYGATAFLAYNTGTELGAYGYDAWGTPVPNRPVTWSSSNPSVASITSAGWLSGLQPGTTIVTATIDGVSATTNLTVGFASSITGTTTMSPWQTGSWTANPGGGVGPYQYQWFIDDLAAGTASTQTANFSASTTHTVWVEIVDANGQYAQSDPFFYVSVNTGTGPYCPPDQPSCFPCDPEEPGCAEQMRVPTDGETTSTPKVGSRPRASPHPASRLLKQQH